MIEILICVNSRMVFNEYVRWLELVTASILIYFILYEHNAQVSDIGNFISWVLPLRDIQISQFADYSIQSFILNNVLVIRAFTRPGEVLSVSRIFTNVTSGLVNSFAVANYSIGIIAHIKACKPNFNIFCRLANILQLHEAL